MENLSIAPKKLHGEIRRQGCCVIEVRPQPRNLDIVDILLSWMVRRDNSCYCLIYTIAGRQDFEYFNNAADLSEWFKLQQLVAQQDYQDVLVDYLYMWDGGPFQIDIADIPMHLRYH